MPLLLLALVGSAIFNNVFFKFGQGSANVLNFFIVATCLVYSVTFLFSKRGKVVFSESLNCDKYLWAFLIYGVITVLLSYAGFYSGLSLADSVSYDASYIPRQAYYLFFIPLIIFAARDGNAQKYIDFISRHYIVIFLIIYTAYMLWNRTIALKVPVCFCLAVILLLGSTKNKVIDLLLLAIVALSPIAVGGEMTQALNRVLCVLYFFGNFKASFFRACITCMLIVIIACYVLPSFPLNEVGLDANTSWRVQYWNDELVQLLQTYGIGVGYGTSYASYDFIGSAVSGPFAATAEYSTVEKIYVVGCHNSFVSLAFRLGVIGIGLLLIYIASLAGKERSYNEAYAPSAAFALISSLVVICFNVGFENPSYFFLFAFSVAFLNMACIRSANLQRNGVNRIQPPNISA